MKRVALFTFLFVVFGLCLSNQAMSYNTLIDGSSSYEVSDNYGGNKEIDSTYHGYLSDSWSGYYLGTIGGNT